MMPLEQVPHQDLQMTLQCAAVALAHVFDLLGDLREIDLIKLA
nr:hypothetical protein [Halochromatium salexigens]